MLRLISIIYLTLGFASHLEAQTSDTIPFTLTPFNNIYVQSVLNHVDTLKMMFHTGENGASITEAAFDKIKAKKVTTTTEGNSWGGKGTAQFFKNNVFSVGQHSFDSLTIWVDKHSGQLTDGKFGPLLFKGKVLEINYNNSTFVVHESPLSKKSLQQFQRFKLIQDRGTLFIKGKLKIGARTLRQTFMIHTGYGGNILIDDAFAKKHQLGNQLKVIDESTLKDAYGNTLTTKKAIVPTFKIGKTTFEELPISFFEGSIGKQKISVLGNGLLKRYNMILDLEKGFLYLKLNSLS